MELPHPISDYLKLDEDNFICCSGKDYLKQIRPHHHQQGLAMLTSIINTLGERSAQSQKLKQIITTSIKFFNTDQRIYIKVNDNKALGFVKVGQKKLFYHDFIGNIKELSPVAVLDIYVHQSCQRTGIGKEVFQKFLKMENKMPQKLAYDRPSPKLISFLKKYYNLCSFIPQNNNYVIFDRFFQSPDKQEKLQKQYKQEKEYRQEKEYKQEKPKTTQHMSNSHSKSRPQNILERMTMNTKYQQPEDSLNKLTKQMNNITFQQQGSFKTSKDQHKSSFGCPWAVQEKIGFRTTSNAYGNYYKHR